MKTHDQLIKAMMKRPGVKAEVDRIEREEAVLLDALLIFCRMEGHAQSSQTQPRASNP